MSIGAQIKQARQQRGLSIEDVARATKIRAIFIEQIENDAIDDSEAMVFVRARIKSVATFVGLDAESLLSSAGMNPPQQNPPAYATKKSINVFDFQHKSALPPRRSYGLVLVVTGLVLLAIAIWFSRAFLMQAFDAPPLPVITNSMVEPGTSASENPTIEINPAEVTMTIVAVEASWTQVTASNGEVIFEKTLAAGESYTFGDTSQLTIRIGNAGGVQVNVNGVELGALGATGEVVDRVFGLGDPTISN